MQRDRRPHARLDSYHRKVIAALHGGMGLSVIRLDPYTVKTAHAVTIKLRVHFRVAGVAAEIAYVLSPADASKSMWIW